DDPRIGVAQRGVVEAQPLGEVTAQVVVDSVDAGSQASEKRLPLRRPQVQREAAGAAVEGLVVDAVVRVRIGGGGGTTRLVTAGRRILDLDDLGTQVCEEGQAEWSRAQLGHGEDAESVEWK